MAQNLTQIFARLIVCAVFLPAGFHALFGTERFTSEEAQRISELGSPAAPFEKMLDRKDTKPASLHASPQGETDDGTSFRALNRIALRLDRLKVPAPVTVAWVVAIVELAGASAMLAGFFTRAFAVPLVLVGTLTLWTTVWPALGMRWPWDWTSGQSQMAAAWLAATLLPVSLALLGPGVPSVDRVLAGRRKPGGKGPPKPAPQG